MLLYNYPNDVEIKVNFDGSMEANIRGKDMTLVVVDGKAIKKEDYSLIPGLPPREVESFEILKNPKNFERLYLEATGKLPLKLIDGGIISIYTFGGNDIFTRSPEGITKTNINVFSAPREFYAPKYKNMKEDEWQRPDLRAFIHWAPEIKTDENGKALLSFYNADNAGDMMIVVEAVSENGQIGYKELIYRVEGKEVGYKVVD